MEDMSSGDVTIGEVARRVERLDRSLNQKVDKLENQMQQGFAELRDDIRNLQFVPAAVYQSDKEQFNQRIQNLEERQKVLDDRSWQVRLATLTAGMSAIVSILLVLTGLKG